MISLVLPAFNPGQAIEPTWRAVRQFLASRTVVRESWEVVFVLDGCTDDTAERLTRLGCGNDPHARIVSYPRNRGKGHAVRTGLLAARGDVRIFTDVDLAYPFEDILRVAAAISGGAPVAIGSRTHPDSRVLLPMSLLGYAHRRAFQGRLFGLVARALLPVSHHDTQAGLKGMTAGVAEALLPHLECNGFGFDCELLTACARAGVPLVEVPVNVRYDDDASTTGGLSSFKMLGELWRIRRRWRNRTLDVAPEVRTPRPLPSDIRVPAAA